jgi:hypothetical protein
MRSSKSLANAFAATVCAIACLIAGCGALAQQQPGTLVIRAARLAGTADAPFAEVALDCRLSGPMQDALDHGIPLTIGVEVDAGRWHWLPFGARAAQRFELRYFPLSRRYQLRDLDIGSDVRTFATPGYLLAGLNSLRLPLPATFAAMPRGTEVRVRAAFDTSALPGALRLPALFEPAWQLSAPEYTWQPAG